MAGSQAGGKLASKTNKEKYGEDFYANIGRMGGAATNPKKGFGSNPKLAAKAGRKGGAVSSRKGVKNKAKEPRKITWLKRLTSRA